MRYRSLLPTSSFYYEQVMFISINKHRWQKFSTLFTENKLVSVEVKSEIMWARLSSPPPPPPPPPESPSMNISLYSPRSFSAFHSPPKLLSPSHITRKYFEIAQFLASLYHALGMTSRTSTKLERRRTFPMDHQDMRSPPSCLLADACYVFLTYIIKLQRNLCS